MGCFCITVYQLTRFRLTYAITDSLLSIVSFYFLLLSVLSVLCLVVFFCIHCKGAYSRLATPVLLSPEFILAMLYVKKNNYDEIPRLNEDFVING